jgi:hypothetical protein
VTERELQTYVTHLASLLGWSTEEFVASLTGGMHPDFGRMLPRINVVGDCWEWQGSRTAQGYGRIRIGGRQGTVNYAHRRMYELLVGPIPVGFELDHLCRNPPCCRPSHLEPVTRQENERRKPRPETCPNGHQRETHSYVGPDGRRRYCIPCRQAKRRSERA